MNDYITRKTEAYMRASQALRRVQPHYEREQPASGGYDSASRRANMEGQYRPWRMVLGWRFQVLPVGQQLGLL